MSPFYLDDETYRGMESEKFLAQADGATEAQSFLDAADADIAKYNNKTAASDFTSWADGLIKGAGDLLGGIGEQFGKATETATQGIDQQRANRLAAEPAEKLYDMPVVGGIARGVADTARESFAGQMLNPYSDQEAVTRIEQDELARPLYEANLSKYELQGKEPTEQEKGKAARTAIVGSGLAMGMSGEPLKPTSGAARLSGRMVPQIEGPKETPPATAVERAWPEEPYGNARMGGETSNAGEQAYTAVRDMYTPKAKVPTPTDVKEWARQKKDSIVLHWFNQNASLEQIQELAQQAARITGDELKADEMAATLNRLNASGTAERKLVNGLGPTLQEVADRGDTLDLSQYLTFRHNVDVADAIGNPDRKFSGDLTKQSSLEAIQYQAEKLGPERFAQLEQDAGKIADFTRSIWDRKLASGLIDQATHDAMIERFPYYTPTKILDYLQDPSRVATGTKINVNDNLLRSLTEEGTSKARQDPLLSVINYAYETEALAQKNETFQAIMNMRDIIPGADQIMKEMPAGYTPGKNEITISGYIDGTKHTLAVSEDLRSAFEKTTRTLSPKLQMAMNVYKALITSRNPVFLASNALNDFGSYAVRSAVREGGPQALPRVVKELFSAYKDAFTGLGTAKFGPKTERFLEGGGAQFGFFQRSESNARQTAQELARRHAFVLRSKSDALRLIKDVVTLQPVEAIGKRIELAPRVAATELARKRGAEWPQAIVEGRSVTMDFAVGGDIAKLVNQVIPFFNVGMQAPAQVVRAYKENPKAFIGTAASLLAAPTVAAEAWNRADPQRAKDYEDVPDYVKASNIVIMLPGQSYTDNQGNVHPQFIAIPTREYSSFVTLTREATGRAVGADPRGWGELLSDSLQSVSPVQGGSPGEIMAQVGLPGATTAAQIYYNKDPFTGAMINTQRKNESASPLSKGTSKAIGGALTPSQVEWALQDVGGGVARAAIGASKIGSGDQANAGPSATPLVGGVVGKFVRGQMGQRLEDAQQNVMAADVKQALVDAGVETNFGPVSRSVQGVPLSMGEQEQYQKAATQFINDDMKAMMARPQWATWSEEVRKKVAEQVVQNAREKAAAQVLQGIGGTEIKQRLQKAKTTP